MTNLPKLMVIGAGISGLSTAIILQELGFQVEIISKHHPFKSDMDPAFASLFPSASVIPHSVYSPSATNLFKESQRRFKYLYQSGFPGIGINRHFELYTTPKPLPAYADLMENFSPWEKLHSGWHPAHPKYGIHTGWSFNCYFADWKIYFPALFNYFKEAGGILTIKELTPKTLSQLQTDILINCSELGALQLFNDPKRLVYQGHLIKVFDAPLLIDPNGHRVSYNFTPPRERYQNKHGNALDVYCYPRTDGWILGGSRYKGIVDRELTFKGEMPSPPTVHLNGTDFPAQIMSMNDEIIQSSFGITLSEFPQKKGLVGYRYVRDEQNGLRLESEIKDSKLIIHNYGHGGAGVTLSWGCAQKVAKLIAEKTKLEYP
ncbi:MAG: FAD-binding oxidoreductase [Balneolaceae bacterium]|nr:FAD-binding oxidoreductase [Balneolaceae bacterium]